MPLTKKGSKIYNSMTASPSEGGYGEKKGKQVFYASENAGTITGVHKGGKKHKKKHHGTKSVRHRGKKFKIKDRSRQ